MKVRLRVVHKNIILVFKVSLRLILTALQMILKPTTDLILQSIFFSLEIKLAFIESFIIICLRIK